MFSDVVMEIPKPFFEKIIDKKKEEKGVKLDTELTAEDLKDLVAQFKAIYKEQKGEDFPQDSRVQLMEAVKAVFRSWNNARAITYRRLNDIPGSWGTAVNVQEWYSEIWEMTVEQVLHLHVTQLQEKTNYLVNT